MIDVHCSGCGQLYRVAARFAGKRIRCKVCSETVTIPAAAEPSPPAKERHESVQPSPARSPGEEIRFEDVTFPDAVAEASGQRLSSAPQNDLRRESLRDTRARSGVESGKGADLLREYAVDMKAFKDYQRGMTTLSVYFKFLAIFFSFQFVKACVRFLRESEEGFPAVFLGVCGGIVLVSLLVWIFAGNMSPLANYVSLGLGLTLLGLALMGLPQLLRSPDFLAVLFLGFCGLAGAHMTRIAVLNIERYRKIPEAARGHLTA